MTLAESQIKTNSLQWDSWIETAVLFTGYKGNNVTLLLLYLAQGKDKRRHGRRNIAGSGGVPINARPSLL
jgi:hypothetical protein